MSDAPGTPPRRPLTRERWQRLAPLVDAVLDQPPDRRAAAIAEISGGDATLSADLAEFIEAYGRTESETKDRSLFGAAGSERESLVSRRLFDASVDLRAQLQAALQPNYTVGREIGGGGMARVFVAEEPGLGRRVVIKVLSPELTEGISAERFAREIKLAASLQQANIVPVLAAGTAAGFPYYVMPLVEGRSLRERLQRDGALPISDAVSILRDVARALVFAHGRGVIHRDIKPGNILLSDRTAVVTDFGIAKALGAARGDSGDEIRDKLSQTGTSIGTPSYMAPEQAAGDPNVDHRADIYSFGCVAYELLSGKPPFEGPPHQVIAAHFQVTPQPVAERRPDTPPSVARLVASCLEKDPGRRPQTADDLLLALDGGTSQPVSVAPRQRPRTKTLAAIGVALLVIAVAGQRFYASTRDAGPLTFAVVPFNNMARDTALDFRSDGIGDEILNGMAKVRGVQIVGRTAAFRYKNRPGVDAPDVATIQRALGARLLLTGTLRESEGRVTISAQLNDSATRREILSESFTRGSSDFGSITDEIVSRVTDTLRARFGSRITPPHHAASTAGTRNAAALDLYLIGQQQLRRRGAGVRQSVESFQKAIDLDANFARAHAALATALSLEPFFVGMPPAEPHARAIAEARLAMTLDSSLADPHVALGAAYAAQGQWARADAELDRAVELEPGNAMVRQSYARELVCRGDGEKALRQLERARAAEPTSPIVAAWLSYAYFLNGRPDSAVAEITRATQLDASLLPVANFASLLSLALNKTDDARRMIGAPMTQEMTYAPYVHARFGDTAAASRLLHEMETRTPRPWFVDVAKAAVLLAERDSAGALSALERTQREFGPIWVFYIPLGDPAFDIVRRSPRFEALLRQANVDLHVINHPRAGS